MSDRQPTRVAVVADSPVVYAGLVALLASEPGVDVVATVALTTGDDRPVALAAASPDASVVVWAPARFGGGDGDRATEQDELDALPRAQRLVVLLPVLDAASVTEAVRGGAVGVLSVDAHREELLAAIRAVAAGLAVVPHDLLSDLSGPREAAAGEASGSSSLTQREREVLALLVDGRANKVIAARLGVSEHTVKTHVASVYEKLHARNRAEAVVAAARHGLVIL